MALDPRGNVSADLDAQAPRLLRRPSDALPPLERVGTSEPLETLRRELTSLGASNRTSVRFWAGRISGRSRRRLLGALGAATVALADQCDRLTDRLNGQEEISEDVAATYGEELARLRAEVLHLRALSSSLGLRSDG